MFDIKSISDAQTAMVDVRDPVTNAPLGATFTVAGPEHPKRKAIEFARQRKLRATLQKTGKLELTDPADDELDQIDLLTECVLGWSGISDNGAEIPFSKDAAAKLFATEGLGWLRGQLLAAMRENERFIQTSAPA